MRKICVVTGTRAEFGLLYWVIKSVHENPDLKLQLVVTGMHLSPEFGMTINQIYESGFPVCKKIETLLSSDSPIGISKSIGLGMISFAEAYADLCPDLILILGDRFEIFAAVSAAMIARIPIAHCHGGEATEGLIDEPIRHSITKMSHIHFTATETYTKRVIQLGEDPKTVFNVGALGIESINKLPLLRRKDFESSIDFILGDINFLVTYHPVTLEKNSVQTQFQELLNSLDQFPTAHIIFTKPNADTDGRIIVELIDKYVENNKLRAISFKSLGQLRYLSAIKNTDIVIGNSSSGLIEVPSFKKATVNIGDRQRGRVVGKSVINCGNSSNEIVKSIKLGLSNEFKKRLVHLVNPYGDGNASEKIIPILLNCDLADIQKKRFFNL